MSNSFSAAFICAQGNGAQYQPSFKNHFTFQVGYTGLDQISFQVADVQLPTITFDGKSIKYGNEEVKYAGAPKVSNGSITLHDYVQPDIAAAFWKWINAIQDMNTGASSYVSTYKSQGTLVQLTATGATMRTWTLTGMFPLNAPNNDGFSNDKQFDECLIKMGFSIDRSSLDGASAINSPSNTATVANLTVGA